MRSTVSRSVWYDAASSRKAMSRPGHPACSGSAKMLKSVSAGIRPSLKKSCIATSRSQDVEMDITKHDMHDSRCKTLMAGTTLNCRR